MPVIDAHQHFWQLNRGKPYEYGWLNAPDKAAIRRDYLPADLKPQLDAVGVTHSVFVQTQHHLDENRWVLKLAEENPWIVGVVGWVDLASPRVEEQVEEFRRKKKFVGVRHITHDEPDDDFIVRPDVLRGLKVLEKHRVGVEPATDLAHGDAGGAVGEDPPHHRGLGLVDLVVGLAGGGAARDAAVAVGRLPGDDLAGAGPNSLPRR